MAKNKKAQILAAVMCATTVVGVSPAISSAAVIEDATGGSAITSENGKAFIEVVDNGAESGLINAQADSLTFTVGNNTFAMDQYSTTISNGTAEIFVGQDALQFSNGSTVQVGSAGTIFSNNGTTTTINGNAISTGTLTAGSTDINGDVISHFDGNEYSLNQLGQKTSGIYSDGMGTTTVENATTFTNTGMTTVALTTDSINTTTGTLNVDGNVNSTGDVVSHTTDGNEYSLNQLGQKTSGIYSDGMGTTTVENATTFTNTGMTTTNFNANNANINGEFIAQNGDKLLYVGEQGINVNNGGTFVSVEADGTSFKNASGSETKIDGGTITTNNVNAGSEDINGDVVSHFNGNEYSLNEIGRNVSGIYSDGQGATTIQGYTTITENGITTNNITTDSLTVNGVSIGDGSVHVNDEFIAQNGHKQIYLGDSGLTLQNEGTFVSVEEDGTSFKDANGTETKINGGNITTNRVDVNGEFTATNGDKMFYVGDNGITARNGDTFVSVGNDGLKIAQNGTNDYTTINGSTISTSTGTLTVDGDVTSTENGNVYSLNEIGRNTTAIYSDGQGVTTIEGYTTIDKNGVVTANDFVVDGMSLGGLAGSIGNISPEGNISNIGGIRRDNQDFAAPGEASTNIEQSTTISKDGVNVKVDNTQTIIDKDGVTTDGAFTSKNDSGSSTIDGGKITVTGGTNGETTTIDGGSITTGEINADQINGINISKDDNGNVIVGDTNLGDLATGTDVTNLTNKVNTVDEKVGDTSKLKDELAVNGANTSLVDAVNAEANLRQGLTTRVDGLDSRVSSLEDRMGDVEDRIDKVGAMAAAIANLRTMGYDPEAPTEIAVGVGQYKSETGLALGVFHYPNEDFMLSASISTSGDEVMGGIGATWKIGRKSAQERAIDDEKSRELKAEEKAAEMQDAAQKAKVDAQRERHAQMLAEREAANK